MSDTGFRLRTLLFMLQVSAVFSMDEQNKAVSEKQWEEVQYMSWRDNERMKKNGEDYYNFRRMERK